MRSVYLFMMVSLDGYFEGPNHDISWHNADNEEFSQFADNQLDDSGTLLFGHRTYDLMANFWPSAEALESAPETAKRMNTAHKVVFSHSIFDASWGDTEVSTDPISFVEKLKQLPGKDIAVFGSSNLCVSLLEHGLLDELRIMVNPVALGKGTPLFAGLSGRQQFKLLSSQEFDSGNVLLRYGRSSS